MIFQEIYKNHLEILFTEFFLSIILLVLLVFGVFFKKKKSKEILNNTLIIYLLLILLLLTLNNYNNIKINIINDFFIINSFTQFIKVILILSVLFCINIQNKYLVNQKIIFFEINILILISLLGLMLLTSSNNFIVLYLALELQSLSFYILTASNKKSILSIEAALKYFILGSIASGFILFGCSIIYLIMGTLNFNNIFLIISNLNLDDISGKNFDILIGILFGFIFILIGLFFKIGVAPFHFWLPDVYEGAPNNISSFFAITPKIAFISVLIRFIFEIFGYISFFLEYFFLILSFLSMFVGSLSSLNQKKIKRLLAYSSISHIGFILIGFSGYINNIPYILFYIIIYIIMSINIWGVYLSLYNFKKPLKYLSDLSNISNINIVISFILVINIFSLAGIPPMAGFFSKLFILLSAIKNGYYSLVFFAIIFSVISSFYYLKIIKIVFFEKVIRTLFISKIDKISSIILIINTQFILFLFISPNILLNVLNKIYLNFLI